MDHVIDYIQDYMTYDVEQLKEEYSSGKYKRLGECPSYSKVLAYCKAHNILVKEHYHRKYVKDYSITPKKLMGKELII